MKPTSSDEPSDDWDGRDWADFYAKESVSMSGLIFSTVWGARSGQIMVY